MKGSQFGFLFLVNGHFPKKFNLQHCRQIFQRIIEFLDILIAFFHNLITKDFSNVVLQILSVGFISGMCFHWVFTKNTDLISSFQPECQMFWLPVMRYFLRSGAVRQKRTK